MSYNIFVVTSKHFYFKSLCCKYFLKHIYLNRNEIGIILFPNVIVAAQNVNEHDVH